jgi:acyl-CoA thioester hydrolase
LHFTARSRIALKRDRTTTPAQADFSLHSRDTIRFSDTDKFGHVSNATFAVYLETGRSILTHGGSDDLADEGCHFVLARTEIDYLGEINWPGEVAGGIRVSGVGNSSFSVEQALFQNDTIKAQARSTIVQISRDTRAPCLLSVRAKGRLETLKGR